MMSADRNSADSQSLRREVGDGFGMDLAEAARILGAEHTGGDAVIHGISTDSRTLKPGDLFVALTGPHFDGHDFLAHALGRGAAACLVERTIDEDLPALRVADSRIALGQLAAAWRARFTIPVVAVTGSNGKTTVKEMLAAILGQVGETLATQGNLNNDIGVPLTLFHLRRSHRYAVLELGANHHGEIAYLTQLVHPDVALITNAGDAHLEGFGSRRGIAEAKGEIYGGLGSDGTAVINADDDYAGFWQDLAAGHRVLRFGLDAPADVRAEWAPTAQASRLHLYTPAGETELLLPLPGRHNVMNALAATAAALAIGCPLAAIAAGLSGLKPVPGRLVLREGPAQSRLIDDTYNANPRSLNAALDVLANYPGEHWLVLGDMGELGAEAAALHAQVAGQARAAGVSRLFCLGELAAQACRGFGEGGTCFDGQEALIAALRAALEAGPQGGVSILIKGSRRMRLENVVTALTVKQGH